MSAKSQPEADCGHLPKHPSRQVAGWWEFFSGCSIFNCDETEFKLESGFAVFITAIPATLPETKRIGAGVQWEINGENQRGKLFVTSRISATPCNGNILPM
jgi:hypothetical protein